MAMVRVLFEHLCRECVHVRNILPVSLSHTTTTTNTYVPHINRELHNFLVQEYNKYSNRVGFSLGVGFATTLITMAIFSNLRIWFAVFSIWVSTIHLCILYAVAYGFVESIWFCLRVVVLSVMLSLLCVNVEILKRWNFANMCRLARAKMKAEPFSVNSLRQFLFNNSETKDVDVGDAGDVRGVRGRRARRRDGGGGEEGIQEMPSMINFFSRKRTTINLYHGRNNSSISSASTDMFSPLSEWSIDWRGINRVSRVAAGAGGLIFRADFYTEPVALKQISSQVMVCLCLFVFLFFSLTLQSYTHRIPRTLMNFLWNSPCLPDFLLIQVSFDFWVSRKGQDRWMCWAVKRNRMIV